MQKSIWIVAVLALIIVVLIGFLLWPNNKLLENPPAGMEGLSITSPKANSDITSPVKIVGVVSGNGWGGFEGQVGTVKLLDENGNQLGQTAILTATTEWMTSPVSFQTYLQFSSDKDQNGALVFRNENPSDMRDKDRTFTLPVKIKKGSGEIMTVKAFFNNSVMDPEVSCNKVFPVEREVPKNPAVAAAALNELLIGLTEVEKSAGFSTSINSGVRVQSLSLTDGVVKIDFNEQLEYQAGGSCRVSAIRAQITETLEQFSAIKSVIISINGRTEDILQP